MKKLFKILLLAGTVIIGGFLILGLVMPKDITVSRTAAMHSSKEVVFNQMSNFKNWVNWSPWYRMDPGVKMTYTGTDGAAGSAYHWEGDEKKSGAGDMKCLSIDGTTMNFQVDFTKPNHGHATGFLKAEDAGNNNTTATWSFTMHMPYPFNAMTVFMNMDKMLGKDFEDGLANMKSYVENRPGTPAPAADTAAKAPQTPQ
jgi:Polyketide cyclase / dehydrase and lipid transport